MPDGPRLTPSQQQAVETTGRSILVSASAGTGKTHVLAERCAHLVCQAEPPCDLDRLLVVTFTKAAAAEMRSRIGQTINRRLLADPGRRRLRRQLALLDVATITTIHAFCLQLVRRWFARIDLDPNIETIDVDEADLIRRDVIERLFADLYADDGTSSLASGFRSVVDSYGLGRDQRIATMVLDLHSFAWSLPDPETWLADARRHVAPGDDADHLPQPMADLRKRLLLDRIEALGGAANLEADIVRSLYVPGADYADKLDELTGNLRRWWRDIRDASDGSKLDELIAAMADHKPGPVSSARGLDELAKAERKAAQKLSKNIHDVFKRDIQRHAGVLTSDVVLDGLARISPHVNTLVGLTEEFDRRYQAVKQSEGRVDFTDLERFALQLLSADASGIAPSQTALYVQDEFDHVLVDEFQDVNPVQEAILRLASRETDAGRDDNLFAVGDVKQSIYRFRLAEPDIFVRRADQFAPGDGNDRNAARAAGCLIPLQANFRSRSEVLDSVNVVFERIMKPQLGGMTYDNDARLVAGAEYPTDLPNGFGPPACELHLVEKKLDNEVADPITEDNERGDETVLDWDAIEREALLAGRRILEITGMADGCEPMTVCEKNPDPAGPSLRSRPVRLNDIVVLLRATKAKANHFERVFRNMGIAVYADLTTGYFTSLEVQDVLSLLRIIDNARQDIPIAAVLRSPIAGPPLNESQLAEIRLSGRKLPFNQAVRRYADRGTDDEIRRQLLDMFARLDEWRNRLRRQPLADVLWQILTETGYWSYVGGLRNGRQRRANLIRLHERARQFGRFARHGLHRFIRFIEDMEESGRDMGIAPAVSEADNVVRIMSIHRSKGLEFPVVVLPDLAKRFNLQDLQRPMLFDRQRLIGLPVVDLDQGIRYPTLSSLGVADEIGRQMRAEELRILYVAMTRAREHLILIGTTPLSDLERRRQRGRIAKDGIPLIDLVNASTTLDWILPAVASMPDDVVSWSNNVAPVAADQALFTVHQHDAEAIAKWPAPDSGATAAEQSLKRYAALEPIEDAALAEPSVRAVIKRVTQPYEHAVLGTVPSVVAASEVKRRFADDHEPDETRHQLRATSPRLPVPKFVRDTDDEPQRLTPAEMGTLMHLAMQHIDLTRPCDIQDIAAQIGEMVDGGLITEQERRSLALEPIAWFFSTDLGRRLMATPDRVQREAPFVLGVSPQRVVPGLDVEPAEGEVVLVRGMIDCLLSTDAGDEVIDFKTDAITRQGLDDRISHYSPQLDMYADAVRRIWHRDVTHRWLVFLAIPDIVEV